MKVTYWINTGAPCEVPMGYQVDTLKEAINDFKDYMESCDRIGNEYKNAYLTVVSDYWPERLYEVGPRGGINRNKDF